MGKLEVTNRKLEANMCKRKKNKNRVRKEFNEGYYSSNLYYNLKDMNFSLYDIMYFSCLLDTSSEFSINHESEIWVAALAFKLKVRSYIRTLV